MNSYSILLQFVTAAMGLGNGIFFEAFSLINSILTIHFDKQNIFDEIKYLGIMFFSFHFSMNANDITIEKMLHNK